MFEAGADMFTVPLLILGLLRRPSMLRFTMATRELEDLWKFNYSNLTVRLYDWFKTVACDKVNALSKNNVYDISSESFPAAFWTHLPPWLHCVPKLHHTQTSPLRHGAML